ncbi:MAG: hypothetical protein U1E73_08410 [Planctomycetota bacterium]
MTNRDFRDLLAAFSARDVRFLIVGATRSAILAAVEGIEFEACFGRCVTARFADVDVAYVSREDLIANKRAVGRPQDRIDADELERLR